MTTRKLKSLPPHADGLAPASALASMTCNLFPRKKEHPRHGGGGGFSRTRIRSGYNDMAKKATEKKTLKEWHLQSGMSVQQFADALGLSINAASNYLNGLNEPKASRAVEMAGVLGVQVEAVDWKTKPKELELTPMPPGEGVTPEKLAVAKEWLSKGKSKAAVAKALGISRTAIYDYL